MPVELDEPLFSQAAGWEVMKLARAALAQGQVLSSAWAPPLLRGAVRAGGTTLRAALVVHGRASMENLCPCRDSRQWGKICEHVVAVGLHWLQTQAPQPEPVRAATKPGMAATGTNPPATTTAAAVATAPGLRRMDGGEPAELHVILPPNLAAALERGRVMLVFEARWSGGRCPLNALPRGRASGFSAADNVIIEAVEQLTRGETPAILPLNEQEFAALLPRFTGHPRLTLGRQQTLQVSDRPWQPALRATLEADGEITLSRPDREALPPLIGGWAWLDGTLRPPGLPDLLREVLRGPLRLTREQVPELLGRHWKDLVAGGLEAGFQPEVFTLGTGVPRVLLALKGGLAQLSGRLQFAYGGRVLAAGTAGGATEWLPDPACPTRYATRDAVAEQAAAARLLRAGFTPPDAQGLFRLTGEDAVVTFLAREFPGLRQAWEVTLDEQLQHRTLPRIQRIEPALRVTSSGMEWFDLGVVYTAGNGQTIPAAEIQRLILSGRSHARLPDGSVAALDAGALAELEETLRDCAPQQHAGGYRMHHTQAGFLAATLEQHGDWKLEAPAAWRQRAARQSGAVPLECPPLGALETVLRPYQKQGVAWLHFLRANHFGGVLADEMGLGKTLQTLAFFQSLIPAEGRAAERRPHLIVCPASLVFNWVAEARKFTPGLKVLALHGPDRHQRFAAAADYDLVVTSYALIRRDAGKHRALDYDTVALDEAQHIKNRQTRNAQAVKAVPARHRLVLTGTPLENSVLDLWSIFDFLMPGYLGGARDFQERYEAPISRERDGAAQARLARRLRPFLLRRLKRDVAADLPARLEQVAYCELTPAQRAVYQQVIEASRREAVAAEGAQGLAKSRMVTLTALLRLRQICCDLRLLKLDGPEPAAPSGKLELFGELLQEVIDGGHRVLVFSQFTSMLALLEQKLAAEGIEFCHLDGATVNRAAEVERFQTRTDIPVFLISLKAGGVGLNLTGADTVMHFDPWWNPAVEDQATDRAHRIGQTRVVTSYKLIARDTVEEKILNLQARKRGLIQAAMGGEEAFAAALNWEEIQELPA